MIDRRVTRLVWCFVSLRLLPSVRSALRSSLNPRVADPVRLGPDGMSGESDKGTNILFLLPWYPHAS